MDLSIKLSNGQIMKGFIKSPGENIAAMLIMVHGLGDHILRYSRWADLFNKEGIGFTGVDLPGHGRSDGKRGHIKNYSLLFEMIEILMNECKKTYPEIPVFLYGHSLGGGIVLNYLVKRNPSVRGAIVTSPWLKLTFEPEELKIKLTGLLKNFVPGLTLPNGLVIEHISNDRQVVEDYLNDPLVHDRISLSLIHSAFSSASETLQNANRLKTHLLLMHGNDDQICSPEGSREFASKTDMVELKIWDKGYHELHNELFREEVFNYTTGWIKRRLL
jgi:alpha-beta hydrolase superfamily lysophospholipase